MKKSIQILLIVILAIALLLVASGTSFMFWKEAPITIGKVIRNIEYKPGLDLDIYQPTARIHEYSPVVVYIHGGAWMAGFKETLNLNRYNESVKQLRQNGYTILSIDYTLASDGISPFPICIEDAHDAINWIYTHSDSLKLDTYNIGLLGESAGAHIALMIGFKETSKRFKNISYIINVFGPTDLKEALLDSATADTSNLMTNLILSPIQIRSSIADYLLGFQFETDTMRAFTLMETYSPINYLNGEIPPVLSIQGSEDILVPFGQAIALAKAMNELETDNTTHIIQGMNHGFIGASEEQMDSVQTWIIDFVQNNFRY